MYIHEQRAHVCGGGQKWKTKRLNQQGWLCLELHAKPLWRFALPVASTAALVGLPTCWAAVVFRLRQGRDKSLDAV